MIVVFYLKERTNGKHLSMEVIMKKIGFGIFLCFLLTCNVSAQPITLKFGTVEPPQSFILKNVYKHWTEKINKEAEGLIKIETYPGGVLNKNPMKDMEVLMSGVVDIVQTCAAYNPGIFSNESVFGVPFIANNPIEASTAAYSLLQQNLLKGYDLAVPLMLTAGGQYYVHTSMPVKVPSDLAGKKIRSTGKMQHYLAQAYGAAPIGMSIVKVAESISRGLIQGTTNEWNALRTFKIDEVAKYHCMVPLGTISFSLLMNKDKFATLPKKAQDILIDNTDFVNSLWAKQMDISLSTFQQKMIDDPEHHVYFPKPNEIEEWKKSVKIGLDRWLQDEPGMKDLVEKYRTEIEKIQKK
jgi:TRAP-type C4-dicarboxylate transport system substrate-binding protein